MRWFKKVAAAGLGLLLLGSLLMAIGIFVLGGSFPSVYYTNGAWHVGDISLTKEQAEDMNLSSPAFDVPCGQFQELDVEMAYGSLEIKEGDDFSVHCSGLKSRYFSLENKGNELEVKYQPRHQSGWVIDRALAQSGSIVITVPAGTVLKEVSVECGAAEASISSLTLYELDVKAGVGTVSLENIAANSVEITGGVGEVFGSGLNVSRNFSAECGMGNMNLQGDIHGEIELESGVGDLTVTLSGAPEEYSLRLKEQGLGNFTINGQKYTDFTSRFSSMPTLNVIEVKNGVGNTLLYFESSSGQTPADSSGGAENAFSKTQSFIVRSAADPTSFTAITQPEQVAQISTLLFDFSSWDVDQLPTVNVFPVCTVEFYQTPTPTVLGGASDTEELLLTATLYREPDNDGDLDDDDWYLSLSGMMLDGTFEVPNSTGKYIQSLLPAAQ